MIIRNVKNVEILSKTLVDGTKEHFETIFYHQIFLTSGRRELQGTDVRNAFIGRRQHQYFFY